MSGGSARATTSPDSLRIVTVALKMRAASSATGGTTNWSRTSAAATEFGWASPRRAISWRSRMPVDATLVWTRSWVCSAK